MDDEPTSEDNGAPETPAPGPENEVEELRSELAIRETAHQLALERLRAALLATDAAVAPELVTGDSVEAIEASFAAAKAMADRVRESVRREQAAAIPGGPIHRAPASPKTALEKIRAGLAGS